MRLRPRLPLLIWRSLSGELVRVLLITSVSLLTVIAFAGAIKPLAEGQIGLGDALLLTLLLSVPMLQFALPFAAGFASTMSYHRMASENEAIAAAAGGVSHRSILVPALLVGFVLAVMLAVLANDAVPWFLREAERLIQRDLVRLLVSPIRRGQPIRFGDLDIYADDVVGPLELPPGSEALESVALFGVLVVYPSGVAGEVTYGSAERADLLVFEDPMDPEGTAVQLVLSGAATNSPQGAGLHGILSTEKVSIPSRMVDDPKFLSLAELRALREDPRRSRSVDRRAHRLSDALVEDASIRQIRRSLAERGQAELRGPDKRVLISAEGLQLAGDEWRVVGSSADARITITVRPQVGLERTQWAASAALRFSEVGERGELGGGDRSREIELRLRDVVTLEPGGTGVGGQRAAQAYPLLAAVGVDRGAWDAASVTELLGASSVRVESGSDVAGDLQRLGHELEERVANLRREIGSKLHERAAYSVACLMMVVTGAVVALRLRESLPLPVYLLSFFPALLAVITISTGQRLMHKHGDIGLLVLWGGVTALALYTLVEYMRLRRH